MPCALGTIHEARWRLGCPGYAALPGLLADLRRGPWGGGGGAGAAYRDHWGGARPASEVTSARNPRAERRVRVSIYFYNYLYIILTPQRINDD